MGNQMPEPFVRTATMITNPVRDTSAITNRVRDTSATMITNPVRERTATMITNYQKIYDLLMGTLLKISV